MSWLNAVLLVELFSLKKLGHSRPLFLYFRLFNAVDSKQINVRDKSLPMTGFESQTSDIGSDRSTNWATTTAPNWWNFVNSKYFPFGLLVFKHSIILILYILFGIIADVPYFCLLLQIKKNSSKIVTNFEWEDAR